jgi:hypothetical protein
MKALQPDAIRIQASLAQLILHYFGPIRGCAALEFRNAPALFPHAKHTRVWSLQHHEYAPLGDCGTTIYDSFGILQVDLRLIVDVCDLRGVRREQLILEHLRESHVWLRLLLVCRHHVTNYLLHSCS